MRARSRQPRVLRCALAAAAALTLAAPAGVAAQTQGPPQPRAAAIADAPDPGVVYDLRALGVVVDPGAGTLAVTLDLHPSSPPPLPAAVAAATVTVRLAAGAVADGDERCRIVPSAAPGDVELTLAADPLDGTLSASATIAPDPLPRPLSLERSPDGERIALALSDPLLAPAAPRCAEAVARGRSDGQPDAPGEQGDDALAGWFDGRRPMPEPPPPRPVPDAPAGGARAPQPVPAVAAPAPSPRRQHDGGCRRIDVPALEWEPFPRELAVRGTALVPVQARRGRRVSDLVATLTTVRDGRAVGAPTRIALPPRGYALQLRAPADPGRLEVVLSWVEQRDGVACPQRSRRIDVAVVRALEPRLSIARESEPARLTLAWGARGHDCHALADRPLNVRLEGLGYVRSYRVEDPCAEWSVPAMALPDVAAEQAGEALRLAPRGEEPGSWSYRLTARSGRRAVARGLVVVTVADRDGELVRSIRWVAAEASRRR